MSDPLAISKRNIELLKMEKKFEKVKKHFVEATLDEIDLIRKRTFYAIKIGRAIYIKDKDGFITMERFVGSCSHTYYKVDKNGEVDSDFEIEEF